MDNKFRIILFGNKTDRDTTLGFLPDVSFPYIEQVENLDASIFEKINKDYYTYRILLLKAGLAVDIGFWEYVYLKVFVPGKVFIFPSRIAQDVPIDGVFRDFLPSQFDISESIDYNNVPLDIALSHGVALYEVWKKMQVPFWRAVRECGLDICLDKNICVYSIDDTICKKNEENNSIDNKIESIVSDIKNILKHGVDTSQSKANRLAEQSVLDKLSIVAEDSESTLPGIKIDDGISTIMNNYFRNLKMRNSVRQSKTKINDVAPDDIQYKKYKKR